MNTLKLTEVKLRSIRKGGYSIGYDGVIPTGATLTLYFSNPRQGIDVTGRNSHDLIDRDNMASFLACIGAEQLWGKRTQCCLVATHAGKTIAEAQSAFFECPIRPYVGSLTPANVGSGGAGPKLSYTGKGTGRMLYMPAIDGCYYFAWKGRFETSDSMRGYDCTTYAGAVFGIDPGTTDALRAYGTRLANYLGAKQCGLEDKTGEEIKKFFTNKPSGTYLMWSDTHVVIVQHAVVHEFSRSKGGYAATPVEKWGFGSKHYWVREPLKQFP